MNSIRKYVAIAALLLGTCMGAKAQVFTMTDEELANTKRTSPSVSGPVVPVQGSDNDQTFGLVPLGSGMMLLAALGGAYLLGKRRKED